MKSEGLIFMLKMLSISRNKDDTYNLYGTDYNIGKFSRKVADEYEMIVKNVIIK